MALGAANKAERQYVGKMVLGAAECSEGDGGGVVKNTWGSSR